MRTIIFAKRNFKEIVRDPVSIIFAVILPLFLLYIFQQFKIPNEIYNIENFTPGIIIFSLAFITMFTASLVAKDRCSSLTARLGVSPMKSINYILSVIPLILIQNILFFITAIILGLKFSSNAIYTTLAVIPISILFISLGILIGTITTEKSSSGISSIIVQLVAFTSGMYFTTDMVGSTFSTICHILPFESTLNITKDILNSNYNNILPSILIVGIYIVIVIILTIILFKRKMISDNK